jgi:hypothetical protein
MSASDSLRARFWCPLGFASASLLAGCSASNGAPLVTAITVPADVPAATPVAGETTAAAHALLCWSSGDCSLDRPSGLCMPKPATRELTDAEDFLERVISLDNLVTALADSSSASRMQTIVRQAREQTSEYGRLAQGGLAPGANTPPTNEEMQHAAWLQSGSTQAEMLVMQLARGLSSSPVTTDAQKVYADITVGGTGLHLDKVVSDLQTFLRDIEVVIDPSKKLSALSSDLTTAAGATRRYLGPVLEPLEDAMSQVRAPLDPAKLSQLENDLAVLSRGVDLVGKDGKPGTCLGSP